MHKKGPKKGALKNIYKNFNYICHIVLKVTDKSNKSIKKIIQINLNCFDRYGDDKFLYKTVLCEVSSHKQYFDLVEIDDINLDFFNLYKVLSRPSFVSSIFK